MNPESKQNNSDSAATNHSSDDVEHSPQNKPVRPVEYIGEVQESQPFVAEFASDGDTADEYPPSKMDLAYLANSPRSQDPVAAELRNISANGGAVGSIVLGVWSILCSLITPFSAINAILALMLGAYGMASQKKRLAVIGIVLAIIGGAMSLIETNEIVSNYFAEEAAS